MPCSYASRACIRAPDVLDASITTVPWLMPDVTSLRLPKVHLAGVAVGKNCDTAMSAALEAARATAGRPDFYGTIVDHWLTLNTTAALSAALGVFQGAGFHIGPRHRTNLHAQALDAARTEFWRRHKIIDALDADIAEADIVGVTAALGGQKPATVAEADAEFKAAVEAVAKAMAPQRPTAGPLVYLVSLDLLSRDPQLLVAFIGAPAAAGLSEPTRTHALSTRIISSGTADQRDQWRRASSGAGGIGAGRETGRLKFRHAPLCDR